MANKLVKDPVKIGSGVVEGGSGGSGGTPTPPPKLPPIGSQCYNTLMGRVLEIWKNYQVVHIKPDSGRDYLQVSSDGGDYVFHVTGGVCKNGYVEISYTQVKTPGVGSEI